MIRLRPLVLLLLAAFAAFGQTAKFPGAVATDADVLKAYDRGASTLASGIDNVTLSIPVTSGATFTGAAYFSITIDNERMLICSVSGTTLTVCASGRGFSGSTAAPHLAGATVRGTITAWHHNALAAEIKAMETALGTAMGNVFQPGKHALFSVDNTYDIGSVGALRPRNVYASGTFYGALSGNASTATALAADPANCASNQFANAIDASGTLGCAALTLAGAQFANQGTTTTVLHGNAAGNPSFGAVVGADFGSQTQKKFLAAPNGADGNPSFRTIAVSDVPTLNQSTSGTAAALGADPGNCAAGSAAGGVTAAGVAEACIVVNVRQINFSLFDAANAIADTNDVPSIWRNELASNATIAAVYCEVDNETSGAVIQFQKDDGTPADVLGSPLTCSIAGASTTTFSGTENVVATGNRLDFVLVSNTNSKRINISIKYTY